MHWTALPRHIYKALDSTPMAHPQGRHCDATPEAHSRCTELHSPGTHKKGTARPQGRHCDALPRRTHKALKCTPQAHPQGRHCDALPRHTHDALKCTPQAHPQGRHCDARSRHTQGTEMHSPGTPTRKAL
eukprot:1137210-Pelagomonas_calceolata.AAC.1